MAPSISMHSHSAADAGTLPRLLILSGAIPETQLAGSLVLFRMLQGYPADRVLSVGPKPHPQSELLASAYHHLPPARSARLDVTRFAQLKRSFESKGWMGRIPMRRIEAAVGAFEPSVVLCVMERRDYLDAAHRFCRKHGVPLVVIVHDRLESFEVVYAPFRRAQLARNAAAYRFASARLCVSPEMEAYLATVYGAPGSVLYPIRSDDLRPRAASASAHLVSPPALTVGYAGSLAYGYGRRIRELAPLLAQAGARLRIYSRDRFEDIPGAATYAGSFAPPELWSRMQRECDVAWLPYGHDSHHRTLYLTHFPSKLTEYAALGMPVLITGPATATGVKWGLRHPAATLTLADESAEQVAAAVLRMREDAGYRVALAAAVRDSDREFDPAAIRQQFVDTLRSVAD
jgi:glycosyltransferase involved in cell wall biosynthesis